MMRSLLIAALCLQFGGCAVQGEDPSDPNSATHIQRRAELAGRRNALMLTPEPTPTPTPSEVMAGSLGQNAMGAEMARQQQAAAMASRPQR